MNYDETQQKLIVREVERDLLAIVAIDIATDEYEVVYSDGAYRDFANRYYREHFFDVWMTSGLPLMYAPDRSRMAREISKTICWNTFATMTHIRRPAGSWSRGSLNIAASRWQKT